MGCKLICGKYKHIPKATIASMQVKFSSNIEENIQHTQKLYNAFGKPQVMFGSHFRIQTP